LGKNVMITDFPELMGAYGCALSAMRGTTVTKFEN
jgi:activator of 2-hydroxyglutaryl-CoA dehydratase